MRVCRPVCCTAVVASGAGREAHLRACLACLWVHMHAAEKTRVAQGKPAYSAQWANCQDRQRLVPKECPGAGARIEVDGGMQREGRQCGLASFYVRDYLADTAQATRQRCSTRWHSSHTIGASSSQPQLPRRA